MPAHRRRRRQGDISPTKIIERSQHNRPGIGKGCNRGIGFSVGLVGESGDRRMSWHRRAQGEVPGQRVERGTRSAAPGSTRAAIRSFPSILRTRNDDGLTIVLPGAAGCDGGSVMPW